MLREWVKKTCLLGYEMLFFSKGFFIVKLSTEAYYQRVLEKGPWFWGRFILSMQRWFPDFNPLAMITMTTLVWVRIPNLSFHFYTTTFLPTLGNVLGRFIKIDTNWISKGFITFAHICIEIKLIQGLPDMILIYWTKDDPYTHMVDYDNASFRCCSCQQTRNLQETCHLSPTPSSFPRARKRENG